MSSFSWIARQVYAPRLQTMACALCMAREDALKTPFGSIEDFFVRLRKEMIKDVESILSSFPGMPEPVKGLTVGDVVTIRSYTRSKTVEITSFLDGGLYCGYELSDTKKKDAIGFGLAKVQSINKRITDNEVKVIAQAFEEASASALEDLDHILAMPLSQIFNSLRQLEFRGNTLGKVAENLLRATDFFEELR